MSKHPRDTDARRLTLVAAAAENNVIGKDGDLPWRLPADLARFKQVTMGHALVMGRKTFESMGKPLPGRVTVVLTRDAQWDSGYDGVLVATSLDEALQRASAIEGVATDETQILGGGEVYRLALPRADRVHLTRVHTEVEGDATFPELPAGEWRRVSAEECPADDRNEHACTFEIWDRIAAAD